MFHGYPMTLPHRLPTPLLPYLALHQLLLQKHPVCLPEINKLPSFYTEIATNKTCMLKTRLWLNGYIFSI